MNEDLSVEITTENLHNYLLPGEYPSPLSDSIFKALFKNNKESLKSFLNAMLNLNINNASDIQINDSELSIHNVGDKISHLDIYCLTTSDGIAHQINVEVQLARNKADIERFLIYLAKIHGQYLNQGNPYKNHPVTIGLIIANFDYFPSKNSYISENMLYDISDHTILTDSLRLIFFSLTKFLDKEAKKDCLKHLWLLFLKGKKREDFEMLKYENKEIEAAVNDLERISQDTIAMLNYAREWRWKGQYEANMQESEDIGFTKGLIKTAVGLKKANVDIDIIVSCTGLSKEEVLAL